MIETLPINGTLLTIAFHLKSERLSKLPKAEHNALVNWQFAIHAPIPPTESNGSTESVAQNVFDLADKLDA